MRNRTFLLGLAMLLAVLVTAACGSSDADPAPITPTAQLPIVIEQSDGQQLSLDTPPQRLISLSAYATRSSAQSTPGIS